jgi:hypothetical protein
MVGDIMAIDYDKLKRCVKSDTILIGFPSGMPHDIKSENGTSIDIADLAEILSFDTAHREGTPFLEDGIASKIDEIKKSIKESFHSLIETGKNTNKKTAVIAVAAVKEFVMAGSTGYTKLEATIKAETAKSRKGFGDKTKPLIDTAQMIGAVTSVIIEK